MGEPRRRAHCLDLGRKDAPAVVLIHGLGGLAQEIAAPLAAPLAERGLRVIAIDRPGYGLSDAAPAASLGPAAQARWLAEALLRLEARVAVIVGHSFGAAVALWLAREVPAQGLVLVNPFCRPTPPAAAPLMRLALAPGLGPVVRRRLAPVLAGPLVSWSLARACAQDPLPPTLGMLPARVVTQESALLAMAAELRGFNADAARLPGAAARLPARIVALTGASDRVIAGDAHGRWLAETLPHVEHRCEPGGHMLHHARPEVVTAAILELAA